MRPSGGDVHRSCSFCRHRKMRCSGEKPWCRNCKERGMPCVYDTGLVRIKKHDEDGPHQSSMLLLPATNQNIPLIRELESLFNKLWSRTRGCWSRTIVARPEQQATTHEIDYQNGLSQILAEIVSTLAVKTLPFGARLERSNAVVIAPGSRVAATDSFASIPHHHIDTVALDKQRQVQLVDLAYSSHPYLAVILSKTLFMRAFNQGAHDKVLLDAILVAGLDLKCTLTGTAEAASEELVELHVMANRTAASLFSVLLGSLNANRLQTCVQSIMLLAWHDLTQGHIRRSSTWWTMACDLILRVRSLRAHEDVIESQINGFDITSLREEELEHMQAISQLMLLYFETSLGAIPVPHTLLWRSASRNNLAAASNIWELDDISGNVASAEGLMRARRIVHRIQAVLGSLSDRHTDLKNAGDSMGASEDHEGKVNSLLMYAGFAGIRMAGPILTLSALLLCLHRYGAREMDKVAVTSTIRVCAAACLHLRDIFGDAVCASSRTNLAVSLLEAAADSSIALCILESVALTFGALMVESGAAHTGEAPFARATDDTSSVKLSRVGQQVVVEKLGVVMGIVCTMMDCLDNVPVGGARARHIGSMLYRLRGRLEALQIQADVSFAFETACTSSSASNSQGKRPSLTEDARSESEPEPLAKTTDDSYDEAMAPAAALEHGGQVSTEHHAVTSVSAYGATPHASAAGAYNEAHTLSLPLRQYSFNNQVVYGPGPMTPWRPGATSLGAEGSAWITETKVTETRSVHAAKGDEYWPGGGFSTAEMSASSYSEMSVPMSMPQFESGLRRAGPTAGLSESLPSSTAGKGFGRGMAQYAHTHTHGRTMSMLPMSMLYRHGNEGGREAHDTATGEMDSFFAQTEGGVAQTAGAVEGGRKRARGEPHAMRQIYSGTKPVASSNSGSSSTSSAGGGTSRRSEAIWTAATAEGEGRAIPAAAALASIQRVEPLTDPAYAITASADWPLEIRERTMSCSDGSSCASSRSEADHVYDTANDA